MPAACRGTHGGQKREIGLTLNTGPRIQCNHQVTSLHLGHSPHVSLHTTCLLNHVTPSTSSLLHYTLTFVMRNMAGM